jgi:hypothetical protein
MPDEVEIWCGCLATRIEADIAAGHNRCRECRAALAALREGGWYKYTDEFIYGPAVEDAIDPPHPDERTES